MLLDELYNDNRAGLEAEISAGIVERIAKDMPELTDHSPGSPHVVIAEGVAWGTSLLMYYLSRQPELYESWLLKYIFAATPRPPTNAQAELVMVWSTPAPPGGRLVPAGTKFSGGGTTWTVLDTFVYPASTIGNETMRTDLGPRYLYRVPVASDVPGSRYNTAANTITKVMAITPGLISVTNPEQASGGQDEEPYEVMKARLFDRRLEEDLLVVPRDFEAAVERYLGKGAATLVLTPPPNPGFVNLSIMYADGQPLVVHSGLEKELNARSPMAPVKFVPPHVIDVTISATIRFSYQTTASDKVEATARQTLAALLNSRTWKNWGSTPNILYRSEIISELQDIPGVLSVELNHPSEDVDFGMANAVPRLALSTFNLVPVISEELR